jgi:hypothetical protein
MNIDEFYKPVHIDNLDEIQKEVLKLIPENLLDQTTLTYIENSKEIFLSIPALYNFLKSKAIHQSVMNIAINITQGHKQGNIHVDSGLYNHSLNIPIIGCENTCINFFKSNSDYKVITVENKGKTHHFFKYTDDQCELIYEGDTSIPYILGTKTPHRVVNKSDQTRIMLLIRLFPGPWSETI